MMMVRRVAFSSMPVHSGSSKLTGQPWDAPWCTSTFLQGWLELQLSGAGRWCFALDQSRMPLLGKESGQQHLKVIGAAMQPAAAQGTFCCLHHRHQGAVAA